MNILGHCNICEAVFESRTILAENCTDIGIYGAYEPCPRCGYQARLLDGVFDTTPTGVVFKSGPARTAKVFLQMKRVLQEAEEKGADDKEVIDELRKLSKTVADAAEKASKANPRWRNILDALLVAQLASCDRLDLDFVAGVLMNSVSNF